VESADTRELRHYREDKMQMWLVKALVVASVLVFSEAQSPAAGQKFWEDHFIAALNAHFDKSVNYMLTSKQYDSQYMERPGMAKLLKEASDEEWEEGMDMLKKYMQRGGNSQKIMAGININAKPNVANFQTRSVSYATTLNDLLIDAKARFGSFNSLHKDFTFHKSRNGDRRAHEPDFELGHFMDKKLSKEAENIYKLESYKTTLDKISKMGVAISMFDEAL